MWNFSNPVGTRVGVEIRTFAGGSSTDMLVNNQCSPGKSRVAILHVWVRRKELLCSTGPAASGDRP